LLGALLGLAAPAARAAELQGATTAIRTIQEALAAPPPGEAQTGLSLPAAEQLQHDLEAFAAAQDEMPPEQAATTWLELWDRAAAYADPRALSRLAGPANPALRYALFSREGGLPGAVIAALPGPDAWPLLAERVAARPLPAPKAAGAELSLRLLIAFINQDAAAMAKMLDEHASRLLELEDWQRERAQRQVATLRRKVEGMGAAPTADVVARFAQTLASWKAAGGAPRTLHVPDLVGLAGEARAEALLREALALPGLRLSVAGGGATLALAQRVALSLAGKLQTAQWDLIDSPEAVELYEAMVEQFPEAEATAGEAADEPDPADEFLEAGRYDEEQMAGWAVRERGSATDVYLLGLLHRGRLDEAAALADKLLRQNNLERVRPGALSNDFWRLAPEWVEPAVLFEFCGRVFAAAPASANLPWREYARLGTQQGKGDEPVRALEQACAVATLSASERAELRGKLVDVYLARDAVEPAVALLRQESPADVKDLPREARLRALDRYRESGERLARLGKLQERPEWFEEGLRMAGQAYDAMLMSVPGDEALAAEAVGYRAVEFVRLLTENGRYLEAEKRMLANLRAVAVAREDDRGDDEGAAAFVAPGNLLSIVLRELIRLYHAAGRHQDVLALFESAPWWGADDLARMGDDSDLRLAAAAALHALGRDAEATPVLKALLCESPDTDKAYELLLACGGNDLVAWLDWLYERDRFEERPLIWKAVLQFKAGQLAEAERTARQALAVDPTDGEQAAGERGRGYAVLADILKAQGRAEDATFFANVVEAVRMAERGDEFASAGLTRRSLPLYEQAATRFLDAYCVQWRLAEQLYAQGDRAGAEKHYRIAFERLPEQFGQVASLCFGCEGVFERAQSRGVAEEVLERLEKEGPKRPQVYYLLGELRQAQGRLDEAYRYYRRATAADPGYLDAWSKAYDLARQLHVPRRERDVMVLTLLRLDPLQRHSESSVMEGAEGISNLKALAVVLRGNRRFLVPPPATLLPLPASKAARATAAQSSAALRERIAEAELRQSSSGGGDGWDERQVPRIGQVLTTHDTVRAILALGMER
jgi:tetratricopeptide (TPR) repeat protein